MLTLKTRYKHDKQIFFLNLIKQKAKQKNKIKICTDNIQAKKE